MFGDFSSLQKRIIHQRSCPQPPQQNGILERMNRHILITVRALLVESLVTPTFWCELLILLFITLIDYALMSWIISRHMHACLTIYLLILIYVFFVVSVLCILPLMKEPNCYPRQQSVSLGYSDYKQVSCAMSHQLDVLVFIEMSYSLNIFHFNHFDNINIYICVGKSSTFFFISSPSITKVCLMAEAVTYYCPYSWSFTIAGSCSFIFRLCFF